MSSRRLAPLASALLLLVSCATTEPFQPADESAVVTLERLAEFGLGLPDGYRYQEKWSRERIVDGMIQLEYEFQHPDQSPPFVHSSAQLYPTPGDACFAYTAGNLGLRLSQLEVLPRDDLFRYGEKSRFGLIVNDGGEPVGNVFAMCHSRTVLLVLFVGIYFEDAAMWRALIEPTLQALEEFEAANPEE